jgi:hypothetical protein
MAHYWLPDATSGTGTGNWSAVGATGHWADDAGGTNLGKAAPGSGDDVFFGAAAFNGAGQVVTVDASPLSCKAIDWTGATNTPTLAGTFNLYAYGDVTFISAMVCTHSGVFLWASNSNVNITIPVNLVSVLDCEIGTGTRTLLTNVTTTRNFQTMSLGSLALNGFTLSCAVFSDGNAAPAHTLNLTNSVLNCTGFQFGVAGGTISSSNGTINCSGNFGGGGLTTYNIVNLTGATSTISDSNTFAQLNLTRDGAQTITFTDGTTQTITNPQASATAGLSGASGKVKTMQGSAAAGWTIATTQGIALQYISVSRSTISGAVWYARNSTDGANNVNWYFEPNYATQMYASPQILVDRPAPFAKLNLSHPLAQGMVGCWLLNELGGLTAFDATPYANHGILTGFGATLQNQRRSNGLVFDGTDDYVLGTDKALLNFTLQPFTISVSFKATTLAAVRYLLSRGLASTSGYVMYVAVNGALTFGTEQAGAEQLSSTAAASVVPSLWYHAVAVRLAASVKLFLDGRDVTSTAGAHTDPLTSAIALRLAASSTPALYHYGQLMNTQIWNRALSPEDIKQLYISPYAPMGTRLFL